MINIILIVWILIALSIFMQYINNCKDLDNISFLIVFIIFIIFSPLFLIVNGITAILNIFLPEGWEDDSS